MSNQSKPSYNLPQTLPTNPLLADLLPDFARQWQHDLSVGFEDLKRLGDLDGLRRLGHTVKGSFLQFGFSELAGIGVEIMHDAAHGDWHTAGLRISALCEIMQELEKRVT